MKKALFGVGLAVLLTASLPTAHAADIQIKVDGLSVTSDAKPEIQNSRTMVPLRVISENLGANVEWSSPEVILVKGEMKVTLKLDSDAAEKNGEKIQLDSKPYMKDNRVFVPLRFIAETFDCQVTYSGHEVTVDTEPLVIEGAQVKAVQYEYRMTMGGVVSQIRGNAYNDALYRIFVENKGQKVEAPASYSWMYNIDVPGSYAKNGQFDFLDAQENTIVQLDVYSLVDAFPSELLTEYPKILLHDATKDEWYLFSDTARQSIQELLDRAADNGFVTVVSNNVV